MIKQISADDVRNSLGDSSIMIIDVRTSSEFSKGSIQGSINIPVNEINEKIKSLVSDKNKRIYLYCLSGSRSDAAASILTDLGYTNAYSMTSGLLMWRFKKYEVISS